MIIDCISDLHGHQPKLLGGDILVIAGDLTKNNTREQYVVFLDWLSKQPYTHKILIAGNHDGFIEGYPEEWKAMLADPSVHYLQDSGVEVKGMRFWGSPWTPIFYDWHFMLPEKKLAAKWQLIPDNTDILVTHGPPRLWLDRTTSGEKVGSTTLLERVEEICPQYHIFGHIHEGYGKETCLYEPRSTTFVNCAIMNERYKPIRIPIRIEI